MDTGLRGRHAPVCGASFGIGRAAALALAGERADLTVLARSRDALVALLVLTILATPACDAGTTTAPGPELDAQGGVPDAAVDAPPDPGPDVLPDVAHVAETSMDIAAAEVATADVATDVTPDSAPAVDIVPDGDADAAPEVGPPPEPPSLLLTVVGVPATMNGSSPALFTDGTEAPFSLHLARDRFTLDALLEPGSGPAAWETLAIGCDHDLATADATPLPAGEPFGVDALEAIEQGPEGYRLSVTAANPAPDDATITCSAEVEGPGGDSVAAPLTFVTRTLPPHLDPFVAPDTWLVVLSRDIFQLHAEPLDDGTWWITSEYLPGGDGIPDFDEAWLQLGIFAADNPASTALVRARLLDVVRDHAHRIFGLDPDGAPTPEGVPLHLYFEGDPGAPPPDVFDGTFSRIALGGDGKPDDQIAGTVGRALIDWNNQGHEDDAVYGLGVFPTAIVRQVLANPFGALLLEQLLPGVGDPIGTLPMDADILSPDFDPDTWPDSDAVDRYTLLEFAVEMGGLALASTLCHEMGHSLGLVPYGLPPDGLFAGVEDLVFTDHFVASAHIDTAGLNVMQTGAVTNWVEALGQVPEFNALNLAYLRRQIVVE